jgi:hypothetical protein
MWDPKTEPQPDDPYVCDIMGAQYYLPWGLLRTGYSFFLPMTARAEDVAPIIRKKARKLDISVEVRQRCEFGVYGVRVWVVTSPA